MSDYIKRKDVVDWISKVETLMPKCVLEEIINKIPSADVVEVVRCKDCKYQHECYSAIIRKLKSGGEIHCPLDFCSEGERAEQ